MREEQTKGGISRDLKVRCGAVVANWVSGPEVEMTESSGEVMRRIWRMTMGRREIIGEMRNMAKMVGIGMVEEERMNVKDGNGSLGLVGFGGRPVELLELKNQP